MTFKQKNDFNWLAGLTDSDGCFSLTGRTITFKISLTYTNRQALEFVRKIIGRGQIKQYNTEVVYRIRDQKTLRDIVFPIFDKNPLFTSKYYYFCKAKQALDILQSDRSITEQNFDLQKLKADWKILPEINLPNPNWFRTKPSKEWLIGFVEGDGSFFITKGTSGTKNELNYVHSFGITQKNDKHVLEWIRKELKINANVNTPKVPPGRHPLGPAKKTHYSLETKSNKSILFLIQYFDNTFLGRTSLYFAIWKRSYRKYKGNSSSLEKIQQFLRRLKKTVKV